MNNFNFITVKQAYNLGLKVNGKRLNIKELEKLANKKPKKCIACKTENEWKLANTELCFSCTTGESDASDDYEII